MADNFRTDKFRMDMVMVEFIEAEVELRIKEFDSCVRINGNKVAAITEIKDGCIYSDVETPVKFLGE